MSHSNESTLELIPRSCCEITSFQLANYVQQQSEILASAFEAIQELPDAAAREALALQGAAKISAAVRKALRKLACESDGDCCRFAARAIVQIALTGLREIATAIQDEDLTSEPCGPLEEAIHRIVRETLLNIKAVLEFVFCPEKCPSKSKSSCDSSSSESHGWESFDKDPWAKKHKKQLSKKCCRREKPRHW